MKNPSNSPELNAFDKLIPNFVSGHIREYSKSRLQYMQQENALRLQKHSPSIISLASSVPLSPSNSMSTSITSKYRPHTKLLTVKDIIRDQKPVALEGWAAVVMCDVSGYSSLASFLALRGPDGAEILGRIMKEYLDKIIQIISLHAGDIVKFVGDAVIFYWKYKAPTPSWVEFAERQLKIDNPGSTPSQLESLLEKAKVQLRGSTVLKAIGCCLDLLEKLGSYKVRIPSKESSLELATNYDERELKIHLGIGAGKIFDVHVGGPPGRWEHFVVGDAMEQLAIVLDLAKPGQVALSKKAFEWFKHCVNVNSIVLETYDTKKFYIVNRFDKTAILPMLPESENEGDNFLLLWDVQETEGSSPLHSELYRQYINQSALFKLESDLQQANSFQLKQGVKHLMSLNESRQVTTVFIKIGSLSFAPVEAVEEAIKEQQDYIDSQVAELVPLQAKLNQLLPKEPTSSENSATEDEMKRLQEKLDQANKAIEESQVVLKTLEHAFKEALQEALDRCQVAMTIVQEMLKKKAGILRQFHVDDKGAVILAFFGLPPLAHKNDARLGIEASMGICESFKKHFDVFSIGVTTGVVSIGGVGGSLRIEYALMGDSINMAARLMSLPVAKRTVICDERTKELCANTFQMTSLGETKVKGKPHPILIFQPTKKLEAEEEVKPHAIFSMVGRNREKAMIKELLNRHIHRTPVTTIWVEAESGQGLTTFGQFIKEEASNSGYFICQGICIESEKATPYFSYRGVLRQLLQLLNNAQSLENGNWKFTQLKSSTIDQNHAENSKFPTSVSQLAQSLLNLSRSHTGIALPRLSVDESELHSLPEENILSSEPQKSTSYTLPSSVTNDIPSKVASVNFPSIESSTSNSVPTSTSILSSSHPNLSSYLGSTERLIQHALKRLPEGPVDAMSVISTILPEAVGLSDRPPVTQQECSTFLTNLLTMIGKSMPLLIFLPDVHYMDRPSWELTLSLIQWNPKTLFVVLSQPMKTHGLEAVMSRLRPTAERIVLNGLTEAETGALIVMVWNQWAKSHPMSTAPKIQSVNPAFVSKLHSISSGNPLYSISLLVSFKDKNLFHINEQGMISVIQGQELDQVLPGSDLIALIFSQFDQLDPTFQTFLKIASVLGQTFSLMDMLDFLEYEEIRHQPSTQFNGSSSSSNSIPSNTSKPFSKFNNGTQNVNSMTSSYISSNYSKQMKPGSNQDLSIKLHSQDQLTNTTNAARVRNKISLLQDLDRLDQFGFLILPEPLLYSTPLPILEHTQVCFKNAAIRESIYSTLLISHRQTLHLSFAQYYESKLKDTGEEDPQLILKIYEHYNKTEGQVAKKIHYLVWVCHLYFKTHAMYEAIRHYTLLLEYVKKNQVASFRHYSTETRALWHRELAEAYLEIGEHDSAESHLRTTLKYLNAMVPKETPQWWLHCRTYWAYWRRHSKSTGSIADLNLRLETYVNYLELDLASKGRGLLHLYLIWQAYRFASSLKGSSSMVACCYALAGYAKLLHHGNINKGNELIQAALQRLPTFSEGVTLLPPWALVKSCEGVIAFFQGQFTHALNVFEQVVQLDMLRCSSLAVLLASQGLFVLGCFEGRHRACRMVAQWLLTKAQKEQHPPWRGKFWCCSILFLLDITLKKNHHPTFLSSSSSFSITASSPPSTSNSTYPMNFVPGNAPNLTQSSNGLTWEEEDVSVFLPLLNKSVANLESIYPLYSHQVAIECVMIVIRLEFRFWHEAVEEQTQLLKELNQIISKLKLYHWPAMLGIFMFLTLVWKAYVLKKVTYLGSLDDLRFALAKIQTHCATHWKFISWASDFAAFAFALDKCLINQSQKCATLWEEKMKKTSGCTNISVTTSTCWLNKYIGARIHLLCKNSLSQLSQTNEMELVPTSISILSNPAQKKKSLTNGRALGVEPEKENTTTTTHIKATAELFSAPST